MEIPEPSVRTLELANSETPTASIILLHGLGDTGAGISPVAEALDLGELRVRFVVPTAPVMGVSVNGGYPATAWYDVYALGGEVHRREDEAGLRASLAIVEELIAREKARGVPAERILLMGFSQGAAMSLLTGLRHAERLAGIVALSGYLPLAATTAAERSDSNRQTPVFLAHGRYDDVVAPAHGLATKAALEELGYDVTWRVYPMAHQLCADEIDDVSAFLRSVFDEATASQG